MFGCVQDILFIKNGIMENVFIVQPIISCKMFENGHGMIFCAKVFFADPSSKTVYSAWYG